MRIGFTEILVILAVALIILGPDKLPAYMKKIRAGCAGIQKILQRADGGSEGKRHCSAG